MEKLGFIILRHVNNQRTDQYWNHCYDSIRKWYPENHIVIIDDNSNRVYLSNRELYKTIIIDSEYPGRGELLPWYYYSKNKWFESAVILHDSAFINTFIDFSVDDYKILWDFEHHWDQPEDELPMLFGDHDLIELYNNKHLWTGCFGGMAVITHDYLLSIKYDICQLLDVVLTRGDRHRFERVIAVLLGGKKVLLGNIHRYCNWGTTFEDKHLLDHLPIAKVWTFR